MQDSLSPNSVNPEIGVLFFGLALTGLLATGLYAGHLTSPCSRPERLIATSVIIAAGIAVAGVATIGGQTSPLAAFSLAVAAMMGSSASIRDLRSGTVADAQSLAIGIAALFAARDFHPFSPWLFSGSGAAVGAAVLILAAWCTRLVTGKSALGHGDIGFAAAGGAWTGPGGVGPALLIAVIITLVLAYFRRTTATPQIPFIPGLAVGFAVALIMPGLP